MSRVNGTAALVTAIAVAGAAFAVVEGVPIGTDPTCKEYARAVVVDLRPDHEAVADHVQDAVRAGHPRTLHIARDQADSNRDLSLKGIRTRSGYDRDEYPPAMSDEGGSGASVRYVESSENRSAGWLMGNTLAPYCNGQAFTITP